MTLPVSRLDRARFHLLALAARQVEDSGDPAGVVTLPCDAIGADANALPAMVAAMGVFAPRLAWRVSGLDVARDEVTLYFTSRSR